MAKHTLAQTCRYVLFTSSEEPSLRWLQDVWREAAEADAEESPRVQYASVDAATDPALAERFAITLPAMLLFKHRKVYACAELRLSSLC